MKFEESIFINCPVSEVFAYVSDYSTHPKWADAVRVDFLTEEGLMGVGTRVNYVDKFMGREVAVVSEITIFEPPHRLGYKIVKGMKAEALQTLTEENGGTFFTWEYMANMTGLMNLLKIAEPLLAAQARKALSDSLMRLKALLETVPIT